MELGMIVLRQTLTMALYMLIGFILYRLKLVTKETGKAFTNLLVYVIIPALILDSFMTYRTPERIASLGISALLAVGALAIACVTGFAIYRKYPLGRFAVSFANCGFFGIPLVKAALGDEAVFLTVAFIAVHNNLQFIYGMSFLSGRAMEIKPKELIKNPVLIATTLGLIVFLTGASEYISPIVTGAIKGVASINSPLAMMVLGIYLAQADLKKLFTDVKLYLMSAVRLLLIPVLTFVFLYFMPVDSILRYAVFIVASAPIGVNVATYSELCGGDYPYACQAVTLCTLLSIVVLPALIAVCGLFPNF